MHKDVQNMIDIIHFVSAVLIESVVTLDVHVHLFPGPNWCCFIM